MTFAVDHHRHSVAGEGVDFDPLLHGSRGTPPPAETHPLRTGPFSRSDDLDRGGDGEQALNGFGERIQLVSLVRHCSLAREQGCGGMVGMPSLSLTDYTVLTHPVNGKNPCTPLCLTDPVGWRRVGSSCDSSASSPNRLSPGICPDRRRPQWRFAGGRPSIDANVCGGPARRTSPLPDPESCHATPFQIDASGRRLHAHGRRGRRTSGTELSS